MTIPTWFDSGFVLTLIGLIGGGGIYLLRFFLKSRCSRIKCCCCIECQREPLQNIDTSLTTTTQIEHIDNPV